MKSNNIIEKSNNFKTIGIVLSAVPGYSETFFRNKVLGLQNNGQNVLLFVDQKKPEDSNFPCKIIYATNFDCGRFLKFIKIIWVLLKSVCIHPFRSYKLYGLDKKDGVSFERRLKNLISNEFFLSREIDWLHFGYGMLAVNRENIAETIDAKMAVSFRGFDLYLSPLKHPNCYASLYLKNVNYHVLSRSMKRILVNQKIDENKIHVIPPAINIDQFKNVKPIQEHPVVNIMTVARLHWIKGLEYTLEALALLKEQGLSFKYTIIGAGPEQERLIFSAYQLGIIEDVIFTGKISHKDVKQVFESQNIYLQYSIQEGFCNAVLEAQAMGLLCVVSDADGLKENILDNETGWIVPKRQPKLLANKINEVIKLDDLEKQKIVNSAKLRVKTSFNLEQQQQAFFNFYNNQ